MVHNRLYMEPPRTLTILEAHRTHKCTLLCAIDILWHSAVGLQTLCKQTKYLQSYKWRMFTMVIGYLLHRKPCFSKHYSIKECKLNCFQPWCLPVYLLTCMSSPCTTFQNCKASKARYGKFTDLCEVDCCIISTFPGTYTQSSSEGECCVGYHSCYRCGKTWPRGKRGDPYMPEYPLNSFLAALTSLLSACFHLIAAHC